MRVPALLKATEAVEYLKERHKISGIGRRHIWTHLRKYNLEPERITNQTGGVTTEVLDTFANQYKPARERAIALTPVSPEWRAIIEKAKAAMLAHREEVLAIAEETGKRPYDISLELKFTLDPEWRKIHENPNGQSAKHRA
jgi:hypothetical protein